MSYEELDRKRELAVALKRFHALALRNCFDPGKADSKPTPKQDEVLRGMATVLFSYVMGGNQSGKSQTGARVVSWFYQRCHPHIPIDELWPDDPMVIIVIGRLQNQVEELWERKIRPYLTPGEYRENRQGGSLQWVQNPANGSKIIFASHANNDSQEKIQSYTAHLVWCDELTDRLGVIEELQRRIQAKRGRMILTFTPKIRAEAVRKFIETPTPYSRIYRISMLDNPVYAERHEELLSQIKSLPRAQQDTILYGEWYVGELAVFAYDPNKHDENPHGYSVLWPHVVAVDPAVSGLMGLTVWAAPYEHAPTWYCVKAEYVKGAAPSDLVKLVEGKLKSFPNIIYRVADTHETWWFRECAKEKVIYRAVDHKQGRKKELISQLNTALHQGRIKLTSEARDLAAEFSSAQWSETAEDKIVNASSYHVADAAQYFVDSMPKFKSIEVQNLSFDEQLHRANKLRKEKEAARSVRKEKRESWRIVAKRGKVWSRSF